MSTATGKPIKTLIYPSTTHAGVDELSRSTSYLNIRTLQTDEYFSGTIEASQVSFLRILP